MHLRTMSSAALAASILAACGLAGAHSAPSIPAAAGGGIAIHAARPPGTQLQPAVRGITQTYDTNWSGYQQVDTNTKVFTAVKGMWTVPTVTTGSGDQYSSDWVGIDGASNKTLIQVGTESDNIGGTAQYDAWTEIIPAKEVITPLVVQPGDQIEGLIQQTGASTWTMTVKDLTSGKSYTTTVAYTTPQQDVEAIHERPCINGCSSASDLAALATTTNVTQLPDYYSTTPPGTKPAWTVLGKVAPGAALNQIFMTNNKDTKIIASPSVLNSAKNGFTVADGSKSPPPPTNGPWGNAEEVPGTAALNNGGDAQVGSVSCAGAGSCTAAGVSTPGGAFVANEANSTWGNAEKLPGPPGATIKSLSCSSAGNCSAGGDYTDSSSNEQVFVVNQVNGTWRTAEEVPGTAKLNIGGEANLSSVSCASPGNCSADGYYTDNSGFVQAFVVNQVNGTWGQAEEVPGTAALNTGGDAEINSISCASPGNCSAGGFYTDNSSHEQAFVVSQVNGTWGAAEEVPGTATLNTYGYAGVASVSCAEAGNCSAGGDYATTSAFQAFVVSQVNGTWAKAEEVPGTAALNKGDAAGIGSVSCASAGNCSAGGSYASSYIGGGFHISQAFVVNETNGTWGVAEEVPGTAKLNIGGSAEVSSVSCASAGNCSAGGDYTDGSNSRQVFVVNESNGTWGAAVEVPGTAALNKGGQAQIDSVSCATAGSCSAGGDYMDGSGYFQAFVVNGVLGGQELAPWR